MYLLILAVRDLDFDLDLVALQALKENFPVGFALKEGSELQGELREKKLGKRKEKVRETNIVQGRISSTFTKRSRNGQTYERFYFRLAWTLRKCPLVKLRTLVQSWKKSALGFFACA